MSAPHLLLSSKAGLAATTPESTHINSGKTTALTAGGSISLATAKSMLATALESINLYAHSQGIELYAAAGKVDIQAQNGDLDIIADKVLQIISAQERIHISAPKEIKVTVAGSYMALRKGRIEIGTTGNFTVHAAHHRFLGPQSYSMSTAFQQANLYNEMFILRDQHDLPIANFPYKITVEGGETYYGITNERGEALRIGTGTSVKKMTFDFDDRRFKE